MPSEKLGLLLVELDKLGDLVERNVNGEDLTAEHQHLESLGDLRARRGGWKASNASQRRRRRL